MRSKLLALPVVILLGACTQPAGSKAAGQPSGEAAAVSIFGTPFLIAFKIPLCVGSVLLAAPAAGASAVMPPEDLPEQDSARQIISHGLRENYGPPYVVAPPAS